MSNASLKKITVHSRVYKILSFLRGKETHVHGKTMIKRVKGKQANLGKDDCRYILKHQGDIPIHLRDKFAFVFTDWRHHGVYGEEVAFVYWDGDHWVRCWDLIGNNWGGDGRVLRRVK